MEQYISEAVMLILGAILGWLPNRKKQKVDTKQIEVEVLEKALQVLQKDVVSPLTNRLVSLQEENETISKTLKKLQNAINQMYKCRLLESCPIRFQLQGTKTTDRKGSSSRPGSNRPRDSTDRENNESDNNTGGDSYDDTELGADQ